jgi:hypothetical protein
MSTEPPKDQTSPVRKPTPEEEKEGSRTIGFIIFLAAIIGLLGNR